MAKDLDGKVFLVTGGTEGIGKAASLDFAKRGATVVLIARSKEKGQRVVDELTAASGNKNISLVMANMARLADVRAAAAEFLAKHDRLDVLVNNAGAVFSDHILSDDGFEMTFALNHLAYFLLTYLLLDVLKKTPGSRVVSTSSDAHRMGSMNLDRIAHRSGSGAGFRAYGDSKLANILFTRELARRFEGTTSVANCFHPGFVRSGFGHNNGKFLSWAIQLGATFARTPEKGAETLVWLATSPDAAKHNGGYFHDLKVRSTTRAATNDEVAKKLWALSAQLCGLPEA